MNKKFKGLTQLAWFFLAVVLLQACYPNDSIPIADLDTATTFYVEGDFNPAPNSAAIIWDVSYIEDEDNPDNNIPYNGEVDSEILNTTLTEMVKLYGESNVVIISETATPSPTPDNSNVRVVVPTDSVPNVQGIYAPSIMLRKTYVGVVYPGYPWWPWWPGWGPCYYCGFPPVVSIQRYDVGSITIDLMDLRQIPAGGPVPEDLDPSWVGLFRGLISSSGESNSGRVVVNIQQAFDQSPYLKP